MSCPYCVRAIALCKAEGVNYEFINYVDNDEYFGLAYRNKHNTVPLVMDKEDFIGGYDDLHKYLKVHNNWQKITWWVATIYYYFTSYNCKYKVRMKARSECKAK